MNSLSYILELTNKKSEVEVVFFRGFLHSKSTMIEEINQQLVRFILEKYKIRGVNIGKNKVIYGASSLRENLMKLSESDALNVFSLRNDCYVGECFVYDDNLIGYTLIEKGDVFLKKGLWVDGKKVD